MNPEQAAQLRAPFPKEQIGKLPRAGTMLSYVGHSAVTDRLLAVDPEWSWEPLAFAEDGTPLITSRGNDAVMWIRMTVAGMTRLGVGIAPAKSFELEKQLISDAIRNAAMRFGVALDLWSKEDLHASDENAEADKEPDTTRPPAPAPGLRRPLVSEPASAIPPGDQSLSLARSAGPPVLAWSPPAIELHDAKALVRSLIARKVSVADERTRLKLPKLDENIEEGDFRAWQKMIADLDSANPVEVSA